MKKLSGKKALITGGARGIGLEIARQLAEEGVDIWLVDCEGDALHNAKREIEMPGRTVIADVCDIGDEQQVLALASKLRQTWGTLHILVNNAGMTYYGSTRRMKHDLFDRMIDVNLLAPIRLTRELFPLLKAQADAGGEAHIVNMCSIFGLVPFRKQVAYQTTKHGLFGFTQAMRVDFAGSGVGVSAICPGFVKGTALLDAARDAEGSAARTPPAWLCVSPRAVARKTLRAIRRDRGIVVVSLLAHVLWRAWRFSPRLMDRIFSWGWGASQRRKRRRGAMAEPPALPPSKPHAASHEEPEEPLHAGATSSL